MKKSLLNWLKTFQKPNFQVFKTNSFDLLRWSIEFSAELVVRLQLWLINFVIGSIGIFCKGRIDVFTGYKVFQRIECYAWSSFRLQLPSAMLLYRNFKCMHKHNKCTSTTIVVGRFWKLYSLPLIQQRKQERVCVWIQFGLILMKI